MKYDIEFWRAYEDFEVVITFTEETINVLLAIIWIYKYITKVTDGLLQKDC